MTSSDNGSNPEAMTAQEFEEHLPEFFATNMGRISDDPRLHRFLIDNPASAALVRDLQYIAEAARQLLEPVQEEPSAGVWHNIQSKLKLAASGEEPE